MCADKNIYVYHFLVCEGQLNFNRWLPLLLFDQWLGVVDAVYQHSFEDNRDIPLWNWNKNNLFSTKSVYEFLTKEDLVEETFQTYLESKNYLQDKIFMWWVENNAIITKDNLIRRHWIGVPACYFCHEDETIDHLFFQCSIAKITLGVLGFCFGTNDIPRNIQQYKTWIAKWLPQGSPVYTSGCVAVCWAIWQCRNRACLDKKNLKNQIEIIMYVL